MGVPVVEGVHFWTQGSGTLANESLTVPAMTDGVLYVVIVSNDDTTFPPPHVTAADYNSGETLSSEGASERLRLRTTGWLVANPTAGTNDISFTSSGSTERWVGMAFYISGVDQVTPIDNLFEEFNTTVGTTLQDMIDSVTRGALVIDVAANAHSGSPGVWVEGSDQTQLGTQQTVGAALDATSSSEPAPLATPQTVAMDWSGLPSGGAATYLMNIFRPSNPIIRRRILSV